MGPLANGQVTGAPARVAATVTTADDLQDAIDGAARSGGLVELAPGTHVLESPLVLKPNVGLVATNLSSPAPVIKAGAAFLDAAPVCGGHPLVTTAGAPHVTIANLVLDQSGDTVDGNVEGRLAAYLVDVRDSTDVLVAGVVTRNPYTYSIVAVGAERFCFYRNHVSVATSGRYDQLDGIHVLDSHTGWVLDNYVDNRIGTDGDDALVAHTIGGPTHGITYQGNVVRGGHNGNGMQLAVGNFPIHDLTIADNELWGGPCGIRTGYYDSPGAAVHDVTISGNTIHNNVGGKAFPDGGQAIAIGEYTNGGPDETVHDITVVDNRICRAGDVVVADGPNNSVRSTTAYTGCRNEPVRPDPSGRVDLWALAPR
ncbi:MAG TPA: hypothetical protein VE152_11975 [Acidimicrobiales bacterium]|nr:hypothetical protein [Acidimicrobiales bacterium]